jgi:murein DD-endopeptidase MepM/ murein hydrolase activator NlpD
MTGQNSCWGRRFFPEIRISMSAAGRPVTVALPPFAQAIALFAVVAGTAALAFLGFGRIGASRLIAEREAAVVRAQAANAELEDDIARLQKKLAADAGERKHADDRLAASQSEAAVLRDRLADAQSKLYVLQASAATSHADAGATASPAAGPESGRIGQLSQALDETRLALHQAAAEGATLVARLSKTEADREEERAQYEAAQTQLQSVIGQLESELLRRSAGLRKLADAAPGAAASLGELGRQGLGAVKRVLASTGVDVARLFSRFGIDRAEGGPFVPPRTAGKPARAPSPQQLAALRQLMQALPLGAPVANYQIASTFGARTDPFNHRPAVHTGIDFDAPYKAPVYATAAGTVVDTGRRGAYGKVVEIDHGDGIHTLYAHLHRVAVAVGQKVAAHTQIGWLGSTGRSSGPHVHYEVLVNGEPQDPEKFIALARLIPAAAAPVTRTAGAEPENSR